MLRQDFKEKNKFIICFLFFVLAFSLSVGSISAADSGSQYQTTDTPTNVATQSSTTSTQNNIQDTPSNTNPTTVNHQATTSTTSSTQNNIQSTQSNTNPTTVNNPTTTSTTTQNAPLTSKTTTSSAANEDPIVITFDDGFESTYTVAFPIMQQYGIKGTVYVVPAWIGGPGYLTLAELNTLHNAGWTIASHTWSHQYLPELTSAETTTELQSAINWLNQNGFQDGAYHLAYPYGGYNDTVIQICSQLGIKTARTVNWASITGNVDYLQLPIILIRNDTLRSDWQSELDYSISQSGTAIFLFHNIVTGTPQVLEDITLATFNEIIAYINQTGVKTETINQWYGERSIAVNFTATPTSGTTPLQVQFTDKSTGSGSLTYKWDFNNDGVVDSTAQNPSYTYNTPGTYTVKLTVTNSGGSNSFTRTNYIQVNYVPPVANFTATPTTGTQPLNVQFTDHSTGTQALNYAWDFGDGSTSTAQNPSHTYNTPGTYTVKLTVTNPGGSSSLIKADSITVYAITVANFTATPTSGSSPLNAQFNDQSTGSGTLTYQWDFNNDGVVESTDKNPSYTYNTPGTYTVKLTVTGLGGSNSITKTDHITAIDATAPTVTSNPTGGLFKTPKTVTLTANDPNSSAKTYYTTDGSDPKTSSTRIEYSSPIQINSTLVLKYAAVDPTNNWSPVYTETYTIDMVAPTVTKTNPVNNATNVPANQVITVTFSEQIKAGTNMWIELKNSVGSIISITTNIVGNILTVTPKSPLAESKYTLELHSGCVTDLAGNPLAYQNSKFTSGTPPTVTSINPVSGTVNVARNKAITVTFSEPIKAGTGSNSMWIELKGSNGTSVKIYRIISGNTLTIKPATLLAANTTYTLILHTGCITDLAGNPLAIRSFNFRTGSV